MKFIKRESEGKSHSFLKLKDGESVQGVFRGEIHSFKIKWENGKSVIVPEKSPSKHNRFCVNFVTQEDGNLVAKVWEMSGMVYDTLYDLAQEMDITKTRVKITRRGVGMDTSYTIIPLGPVQNLSAIESVALNILDTSKTKPQAPPQEEWAPMPEGDDEPLPF